MPITHANSELVARAWLRSIPGIPSNGVGTTLPEDNSTWSASGFVQFVVTGGGPNLYYPYRSPVVTCHCWTVNVNGAQVPWGKANDLAESILSATYDQQYASPGSLSLGVTGAPDARILQVNSLSNEPRRVPGDHGHYAHYTFDIQIFWVEVE